MNNKILTTPFKKRKSKSTKISNKIKQNKHIISETNTRKKKHRINQITHTHFIATCIRQNI